MRKDKQKKLVKLFGEEKLFDFAYRMLKTVFNMVIRFEDNFNPDGSPNMKRVFVKLVIIAFMLATAVTALWLLVNTL